MCKYNLVFHKSSMRMFIPSLNIKFIFHDAW